AGRPGFRADPPPANYAQTPAVRGYPAPGAAGVWRSRIPARGLGFPAAAELAETAVAPQAAASGGPARGRRALRAPPSRRGDRGRPRPAAGAGLCAASPEGPAEVSAPAGP